MCASTIRIVEVGDGGWRPPRPMRSAIKKVRGAACASATGFALASTIHIVEVADARLKLAQPKVLSFYEYPCA